MNSTQPFSVRARLASFRHAFRGLTEMLRTQPNARLHAVATGLVIVAGIVCRLSGIEWCLIVLATMAVWTAEAMNTALECLTDVASPDFHPLAGKAKDIAAGAVLIAAFAALLIGAIVFVPHVVALT